MPSIYERALGSDFAKLHPKIQERFGFDSTDRRASLGVGAMHHMWCGSAWRKPFLMLGAFRNIMFPDAHNHTPFVVENYAYLDPLGRETVTWIRTFDLPKKRRRFDAYMVYSEARGTIVDYLGTHQHLAVDLDLRVDSRGGLQITSGDQRFYEHLLGFRIPATFTGTAEVCEWFDDATQNYRIRVAVKNLRFGQLFGYEGSFQSTWVSPHQSIPPEILPRRVERRE